MIRYIFIFGILTIIHASNVGDTRTVKTISNSLSSGPIVQDIFQTAHKRTGTNEFQTAHKITNERPTIKGDHENIMQDQNPHLLLSSKERPKLNPVLSMLINEDIMKSIESKRTNDGELIQETNVVLNGAQNTAVVKPITEDNLHTLTTTEKPSTISEDETSNGGLIDQYITLEEAGSESNQKSRIEIKKGPNGVDYEYEYVYYYYDEDDKNNKNGKNKEKDAVTASSTKEGTTRGKSRYTNIDRSTTLAPGNEVPIRGRSVGDLEEVRLPQNTRFPPRSRTEEVTPASDAAPEKKRGRAGVKRPSLDLIDSDTFNTDEKLVKNNRNIENELGRKSSETTPPGEDQEHQSLGTKSENEGRTTNAESDVENTTPLTEKAAWDLYAIIAHENFNMDATTGDIIELTTTDSPTTNAEDVTTTVEEEVFTTTMTAMTTTTTQSSTTTTTTTTAAPTASGKKGLGGRNRFRLKNGKTTTSTTEAPIVTAKTGGKPKGRFSGRPTFGSGRIPRPTKEQKEEVKEEINEEQKSSSTRGRTRNRFNLRGSSSTTDKSNNENTIELKPTSTTQRTLRGRNNLTPRGRGRPTAASTSESESTSDGEKLTATAATTPQSSRFNLGRPAGSGVNRLIPRGRINPLKPSVGPVIAKESTDDETAEKTSDQGVDEPSVNPVNEDAPAEDKASQDAPVGGLNRFKIRPKAQVAQKASKTPTTGIVRKPNPLISRKRIGASSVTTEDPNEKESRKAEDIETENIAEGSEDSKNEAPLAVDEQITETSSEPPARGLNLLANRRRLSLRKPGTTA